MVFSRNIIYAAFSLLFTFSGVAGLYVLLFADFLAVTQILIYVGGILVLLLFGVMLTNKVVSVDMKTGTIQAIPALIMAAVVGGTLAGIFYATWKGTAAPALGPDNDHPGARHAAHDLLYPPVRSRLGHPARGPRRRGNDGTAFTRKANG